MALRRSARVGALVAAGDALARPVRSSAVPSRADSKSKAGIQKQRNASKGPKTGKSGKQSDDFAVPSLPSTPRRTKKTPAATQPPVTPTPAAVKMMAVPYSSGDIDDATPTPPADRPAEPHRTNAPLISPETSRQVTYSDEAVDSPPSRAGVPRPSTSTDRLLEEAKAHLLSVDARLKPVIDKHHCHIFSPDGLAEEIDPFRSLASGIIAQQVSGAAAKAIKKRFVALFNDAADEPPSHAFPTPSQVAGCDLARLRSAGLSGRKAEYIQGLAAKFAAGELSADMLLRASDAEVLEKLTAVRGLGRWSVEMFACFGLKRLDVFSTGDLGVQRGMAAHLGKDVSKLKGKGGKWKYMSEHDMLAHSAKFAPYRSLYMWYMWRVENVDVDAVQNN
ncbi:MAG: 3-methyladenine DNA glycosylase [Thelocarpon impressellum]|nr:MAG: 3-methyladenine DNA glycosylase [Thelocarpon impressellum]